MKDEVFFQRPLCISKSTIIIFLEEDERGRAMMTTDEERCCNRIEIKLCRYV